MATKTQVVVVRVTQQPRPTSYPKKVFIRWCGSILDLSQKIAIIVRCTVKCVLPLLQYSMAKPQIYTIILNIKVQHDGAVQDKKQTQTSITGTLYNATRKWSQYIVLLGDEENPDPLITETSWLSSHCLEDFLLSF